VGYDIIFIAKVIFLSPLESLIMILPPQQSRWSCLARDWTKVAGNAKRKFPPMRLVSLLLIGLSGTGCLGLAILFANCGIIVAPIAVAGKPVVMASDKLSESIEHAKGPLPEADWNHDKLWYRIADAPPTYVPKGYSRDRSLGPSAGMWMVDKRDAKRLFIPKGGVGEVPEGTYRSVARYATQWKPHYDKAMGSLSADELTLESLILGVP
jgi:hypothetical protein